MPLIHAHGPPIGHASPGRDAFDQAIEQRTGDSGLGTNAFRGKVFHEGLEVRKPPGVCVDKGTIDSTPINQSCG